MYVFPVYIEVKDQKSVSKLGFFCVHLHKNNLSYENKKHIAMASRPKLGHALDLSPCPMLNNDRMERILENYHGKYGKSKQPITTKTKVREFTYQY